MDPSEPGGRTKDADGRQTRRGRLRLAFAQVRSRVFHFINEITLYTLLPVTQAVLQEDEFRHLTMPVADRRTAPHIRSLRVTVSQAVESLKRDVTEATRNSHNRWLAAALGVVAAVVLDLLLGLVAIFPLALATGVAIRFIATPQRVVEEGLVAAIDEAAGELTLSWVDVTWMALGGSTIALFVVWVSRRAFAVAGERWRARENAVADQIRPSVRAAINEFVNQRHPRRLLVENAPGLTELHTAHQLIRRGQFERLRMLIDRLGAKTVAISGPRGIGKTTMLRQVGTSTGGKAAQHSLRVVVSAPHTYEPRDFLLHLYIRLCDEVLQAVGVSNAPRWPLKFATTFIRAATRTPMLAALAVLLFLLGVGHEQFVRLRNDLPEGIVAASFDVVEPLLPTSSAFTVLAIVSFVVLYWLAGRFTLHGKGATSYGSMLIARQAEDERRRLGFLRTVTAERQRSVGKWGLKIGTRSANQLAERPTTLPELVDGYRLFAAGVARWLRQENGRYARVIVAVDEVDRISEAEAAEAFLNGIKPILGSPDVVYVVTVSEEALARIEQRRGYGSTIIDSVFDAVVRIERLSLRESIMMIRRRVIGFPDVFIALAHCLAGGIARDLIRIVRAMVEIRATSGKSELAELVPLVVSTQIEELKRNAISRMAGHPGCSFRRQTSSWVWSPGSTTHGLLWDPMSPIASDRGHLTAASEHDSECTAAYYNLMTKGELLATVHEVFGGDVVSIGSRWNDSGADVVEPDPAALRSGLRELEVVVEELTEIHQLASTDIDGTRQRLDALRADLGLSPDPTTSATSSPELWSCST